MLDDIDYSDLSSSAQQAEAKPAKKSTITERKISAASKPKATPKPIDTEALEKTTTELQESIGSPEINDPAVEYGLPVMGGLAALATAYGLYQASQNKGPIITGPAPVPPAPPAPPAPAVAPQPPAPVDRLQQAQQRIEEGRQAGLGIKPPVEVPPSAVPTYTAPAPMTVEQLDAAFRGQNISTPLTSAPVDAPAPLPSAAPGSAVTEVVADTLKELIQEPVAPSGELMTGTGKPAFAGQGPEPKINKRTGKPQFKSEYGSLAEVPQGYALIPNAQYIDALRQDLGQAEYTKAFTGRDFPTDYEQAVATGKDINRSLGRSTREEAKAAGQAYGEITPGITQRTTTGKKLVNVGGKAGIAGALVALSDLAKAETASQRGIAGANLLEAVLPPTMMMSGAGEGSSTVPSQDAALLLGSPYAFSEAGKKFRQDQAYTRKVGAGRGIAPPSAYKR